MHIYVYLDHFTVTTVSQSQTSAHILTYAAKDILAFKVALVCFNDESEYMKYLTVAADKVIN